MDWREKYKEHLTPTGMMKKACSPELKTEIFIAKATKLHNGKYDYSKAVYTGSRDKVNIICPVHGMFSQQAGNHLQRQGCPLCSGNVKKTTEDFISQAREVHGDTFDYSKVEYTTARDKITIICPIHGDFEQVAYSHLSRVGCPHCYGRIKKTTEEFVAQALLVHGNRYTYDNAVYTGSEIKVSITCPEHGDFEQKPSNHLVGKGCPKCAGKNQDTVYLIEYLGAGTRLGTKVGITNNFDKRFTQLKRASPYDMEFVQCWVVEDPRAIESKVLERFTRADNLGASFDGSTEILKEPTEQIAQFIEGLVYASI